MKNSDISVLNTPCRLTDADQLITDLEELCATEQEQTLSVDFTNVHIVTMRSLYKDFKEGTASVDWFVPDSQILTWAVSWLGGKGNQRVYGPDFLDYFVRNADTSLTHYFFGASQECLDLLLENLQEINPDLKVVGSHNGYFGEADEASIIEDINSKSPDILWVGLGTPKQQHWINQYKNEINARASLAVGFAFDVNAGTKKDAPGWLGPLGLIWLYRFCREPIRLFKRYFYYNSLFVLKLVKQKFFQSKAVIN